jgi:hypothetical protein
LQSTSAQADLTPSVRTHTCDVHANPTPHSLELEHGAHSVVRGRGKHEPAKSATKNVK